MHARGAVLVIGVGTSHKCWEHYVSTPTLKISNGTSSASSTLEVPCPSSGTYDMISSTSRNEHSSDRGFVVPFSFPSFCQ